MSRDGPLLMTKLEKCHLTLSSRRAYVRRHKKTIGFGVGRISDALRK